MPRGCARRITFPEGLRIWGVEGVQALPGVWGVLSTSRHRRVEGARPPQVETHGEGAPWSCSRAAQRWGRKSAQETHCEGAPTHPHQTPARPPLTFSLDAGSGASFRSRRVYLLGWATLWKGTPGIPLSSSTQDSRPPSSSALGPDTGNPAETPWGQKVQQPKGKKLVKTLGEDRN